MAEVVFDATDVKENPKRYCRTCGKMVSTSSLPSESHLSPTPHFTRLHKGRTFFHLEIREKLTPPCPLCSFLRKELGKELGKQLDSDNLWPQFKAFAEPGPGDPAAAFVDVRPPNINKSSAPVFEASARWLSDCLSKHKQCTSAEATQNPLLPTRVVDVGGNDPGSIAKLHVSTEGERGAYCCLSYCWGGANQYITTRDNLESMTREIPKSQLAQTILDAIEATRLLGFRFLWVDALCIIQDSDEDKSTEINEMGAIFKNATLTIAAATARSAEEGFLRTPKKELQCCSVRLRLPNNQIGTVLFSLREYYFSRGSNTTEDNPLQTRGWCLQEFLLSPRLLIFFNLDVVYCCQTNIKTYTDNHFSKTEFDLPRLPPGYFGRRTIRQAASNFLDIHLDSTSFFRTLAWENILLEFTGRQLTFPSDRLAALAGVSRELGRIWDDHYFYGFWRKLSVRQVAWKVYGKSSRISKFPTWSWASVDSPISTSIMHRYEFRIEAFIESTCPERGADSAMSGPMLALRGRLIEPLAVHSASIANPRVTMFGDVAHEDPDLVADKAVCYFMLGYSTRHDTVDTLMEGAFEKRTMMKLWFLIVRKAENDGVYSRVGVVIYVFVENVLLRRHSQLWNRLKSQPIEVIRLI